MRALWHTFRGIYLLPMILYRLVLVVCVILKPVLLQKVLLNVQNMVCSRPFAFRSYRCADPSSAHFFSSFNFSIFLIPLKGSSGDGSGSVGQGFILVVLLVLIAILQASYTQWFYWCGVKCALSVRSACIYLIYKKGAKRRAACCSSILAAHSRALCTQHSSSAEPV